MEKKLACGGRFAFALRFNPSREISAGVQNIVVSIEIGENVIEVPVTLNVHKAIIPQLRDSKLSVINWVHPGVIAEDAKTDRYTEEYFEQYKKMLPHLVDIRNNALSIPESWQRKVPDESIKDENGKIIDFDLSNLERSLQLAEKAGMTEL
jgi:hypothetical protein